MYVFNITGKESADQLDNLTVGFQVNKLEASKKYLENNFYNHVYCIKN